MEGCAVAAVICAAGSSVRMGGIKKEYEMLPSPAAGEGIVTVLGSALSVFAAVPQIKIVVIVVPADAETGEEAARKALPPHLLTGKKPLVMFVPGGKTRRASVHHALSLLADYHPRYVLIHDGGRPWLTPSLVMRIIEEVKKHLAVIPLLPLTETPKEMDRPFGKDTSAPVFIRRHLKRVCTGTAQTPQAFAFPEILYAHEKAAVCEQAENVE